MDTFTYLFASESAPGSGDTITNFDANDDSEDILLNGFAIGTFNFIGTALFNGDNTNAEARFTDATDLLEIDSDADGTADMEITLTGVNSGDLDNNDFTDSGGPS